MLYASMIALLMCAAASMAAALVAFAMLVSMVATSHIRIICQIAGNVCLDCCIRTAGHTAEQLDACCRERHLRTAADAAADQYVRMQRLQNTRKCSVAAAVGADHLGVHNLIIFNIVHFKLLGMTEMLENLSILISYRNSHRIISFHIHAVGI